jgi:hypothetical protein
LRASRSGGARLIRLAESPGGIDAAVAASPSQLKQYGLDEETISALKNPDEHLLEQDLK